jgi:hypothetical protein
MDNLDHGRTVIMAVIRTEHGRERTRFHLTDEKRMPILKARRYKNDAVLYVFTDREPSPYLIGSDFNSPPDRMRRPSNPRYFRGYFAQPAKTRPIRVDWHQYGIKRAHEELLRLAGNSNAVVHSYVPEATTYGYMYAFEHKAKGWLKIGMTNKPDEYYCWTRIRSYCAVRGLPENGWELLGLVKTGVPAKLEDTMHRKLRQYRVTQEDGETELFTCPVAVYQEALAALAEFITKNPPRSTAEALAHTKALREKTAQENAARHQQILQAKANRQKYEARRRREASQRATAKAARIEAEKLAALKRAADQRAAEVARLDEELATLQAKENAPKWFDWGGKARRQTMININDRLIELAART